MAERALKGPLFYRGFYSHRSIQSGEMTKDERREYRAMYRKMVRQAKPKTYHDRMRLRKIMRTMLYAEFGERKSNRLALLDALKRSSDE